VGLLIVMAISAFTLSLWMSNTAATAITLPIAISVAGADRRFGAALVLVCAYGASVGGIGTPVGTPPNLIGLAALRQAGVEIGFARWMSFGVPIGAAMLLVLCLLLSFVFRLRTSVVARPPAERRPWNRGEVSVVISFVLAITGWLLPTFFSLAAPGASSTIWIQKHLTEEIVALLAGTSLFLLPGGPDRPALLWREGVRIDWSVIFLFGGGMLLGELANRTGLAGTWGDALLHLTGANDVWTLTAVVTAAAILLSEATSNTATATLLCPLVVAMAHTAGVSPIPPVLGATLGASFGFMLPISTAPNAMAYGTGKVSIPQMMRAGVAFDILGFLLIVGGLRLLCPILGLE
jgi:sodium-dependent dicarboxylate transporter 2/3/5